MHFAVDEDDDGSSPFGPRHYILGRWLKGQISVGPEEPKTSLRDQDRPRFPLRDNLHEHGMQTNQKKKDSKSQESRSMFALNRKSGAF